LNRRPDRWLDYAIRLVAVVAVVAAAYLGYTYWSSGQTASSVLPAGRAVDNLREVVKARPSNASARVRLAEALAYEGDIAGAAEQFDAALKIDPKMVTALSGIATVAMKQGDFEAAAQYWKRAVDLLDQNVLAGKDVRLEEAYYGWGVCLVELKRYEEAVVSFKEALRITRSASDTHYMLSVAYRELGYVEKQREELALTVAFDPANSQANYDLGLLALKDGDVGTAAELFRMAVHDVPEGIDLPQQELDKLAAAGTADARLAKAVQLRETDPTTALLEARVAAALAPDNVSAVRLVAELWDKKGSTEHALNAYKRLVELVPQDTVALEAIKRLSASAN
jgi:tetratricopeptide (TPR) repeat protein